jgi:hypothetical protein
MLVAVAHVKERRLLSMVEVVGTRPPETLDVDRAEVFRLAAELRVELHVALDIAGAKYPSRQGSLHGVIIAGGLEAALPRVSSNGLSQDGLGFKRLTIGSDRLRLRERHVGQATLVENARVKMEPGADVGHRLGGGLSHLAFLGDVLLDIAVAVLLEAEPSLRPERGGNGDPGNLGAKVDLLGLEVERVGEDLGIEVAAEGVLDVAGIGDVDRLEVGELGPGPGGRVGRPVDELVDALDVILAASTAGLEVSRSILASVTTLHRAFDDVVVLLHAADLAPELGVAGIGLGGELADRLLQEHVVILTEADASILPDACLLVEVGHVANGSGTIIATLLLGLFNG